MTDMYDGPDDREPRAGAEPDGDALEHLWNAAHEMLRAMRTVLDAADEFVASQRGAHPRASRAADERAGRVRHIDIDLDRDPARDDDAAPGPDPRSERA